MSITTCRRIAAHYIYYRRSFLRHGIVSFSEDGTVTGVEASDSLDFNAGVEFHNGILIPDMVNAHCHLELSAMRGRIAKGGGFASFAQGLSTERSHITEAQWQEAAVVADGEMWREGVGAVGDICNSDHTFAAKSSSPIRYTNFLELYGLHHTTAESMLSLEAQARREGLRAGITPHATYSLNDVAFADAVDRTGGEGGSVPLSIHFMESPAEEELFRGEGHMQKWYAERGFAVDFTGYGSPAERIIAQITGDRKVMLIHNCLVTEEIIDRMAEHFGGNVSWVICPRSNMYISGIMPPYEMLHRKGVRVAIGTDSLASNDSLNLVEELKMLSGVPLEKLLEWATVSGAEALNMCSYGGFEVGKRSGAVLLKGVDWGRMALTDASAARRIF